jgi:hypothetical protein
MTLVIEGRPSPGAYFEEESKSGLSRGEMRRLIVLSWKNLGALGDGEVTNDEALAQSINNQKLWLSNEILL